MSDKILVKFDAPTTRIGSIEIPDTQQVKSQRGIAIITGAACKYVKDGDIVVLAKGSGTEWNKDQLLYIIKEKDVLYKER